MAIESSQVAADLPAQEAKVFTQYTYLSPPKKSFARCIIMASGTTRQSGKAFKAQLEFVDADELKQPLLEDKDDLVYLTVQLPLSQMHAVIETLAVPSVLALIPHSNPDASILIYPLSGLDP